MNILVSINHYYIRHFITLCKSLTKSNPNVSFDIYIFHQYLNDKDQEMIIKEIYFMHLHFIHIDDSFITDLPVYEKRYPVEIYFRLFAPMYLPNNIDRILYLDVDIVVINSIMELYHLDFHDALFIGTSHIGPIFNRINAIRLGVSKDYTYLNTGVLLMNLEELRKLPIKDHVFSFMSNIKHRLLLPDQDILFSLYGNRVKKVDSIIYNFGDRERIFHNIFCFHKLKMEWIRSNVKIIHYYGRNKPWNRIYIGKLDVFYKEIK